MTRPSTRDILALVAAASLLLTACSDDKSRATEDTSPTTPSSGTTAGVTKPMAWNGSPATNVHPPPFW